MVDHLGVDKTIENGIEFGMNLEFSPQNPLMAHFYWPGIYGDVCTWYAVYNILMYDLAWNIAFMLQIHEQTACQSASLGSEETFNSKTLYENVKVLSRQV